MIIECALIAAAVVSGGSLWVMTLLVERIEQRNA